MGEAIPEEILDTVLRIGRAEWGSVSARSAEEHGAHVTESVKITAAHFEQTDPQPMHGLYVEGTETVVCHTGTSPNSPTIARAMTGAWNALHDECVRQRAMQALLPPTTSGDSHSEGEGNDA